MLNSSLLRARVVELLAYDPISGGFTWKVQQGPKRAGSPAGYINGHGYWCVVCGRYLAADEYGVIVHDNVPHPESMTFDEEETPQ